MYLETQLNFSGWLCLSEILRLAYQLENVIEVLVLLLLAN